jgi:hypothetical protein
MLTVQFSLWRQISVATSFSLYQSYLQVWTIYLFQECYSRNNGVSSFAVYEILESSSFFESYLLLTPYPLIVDAANVQDQIFALAFR